MTHIIPFEELQRMAKAASASGMFKTGRSSSLSEAEAVVAMLLAQADGFHPVRGLLDYHIIQGRKPALTAEAMLARFQASGGKVKWVTYSDDKVTGEFSHPSGGSVTIEWTIEKAKQLGLTRSPVWKDYPGPLLRSRCISEGVRTVAPASVLGYYTPEETASFDSGGGNPKPAASKTEQLLEKLPPVEKPEPESAQTPAQTPDPLPDEEFIEQAPELEPAVNEASSDKLRTLAAAMSCIGLVGWPQMREYIHTEMGLPSVEKMSDIPEKAVDVAIEILKEDPTPDLEKRLREQGVRPCDVKEGAEEWIHLSTIDLFRKTWLLERHPQAT